MKIIKHPVKIIYISLLLSVLLLMASCEKNKDPLYVGTWEYKTKIYAGDLTFNTTRTLILTKNTYQEVYLIQLDNSTTISAILGTRGDLTVKGNKMTFKMNAVGECIKDTENKCTSDVEWFDRGSPTYNDYIQYIRESFTAEFAADENYLWLMRDMNNDGDTEDAGEDIEFERK
jgi:hypothetical protein